MGYFTANWGYPWVAVVTLLVVAVHEKGLRSLNRRSTAPTPGAGAGGSG